MTGCGKIARPAHGIGAEKLTNEELRSFIRTHAPADVIAKLKKVMKRDELCSLLDLFADGQKLKGTSSTNTLLKRLGRSMAATRIQRTLRKSFEEGRFHMMKGPKVTIGTVGAPRRSHLTGEIIKSRPPLKKIKMKYTPEMFAHAPLNYRHMIRREAAGVKTEYVPPAVFGSNEGSGSNGSGSNRGAGSNRNGGYVKGGNLRPRAEDEAPTGTMGRFTKLGNNAKKTTKKVMRKRAPRLLNFPTFYSSMARVPTRSEQTRSMRGPASARQKREMARRRIVRQEMKNVFGSASSGSNREMVESVLRNMPEVIYTSGISAPENKYKPSKKLNKSMVRVRLFEMLRRMNKNAIETKSVKNIRKMLAEEMRVDPKTISRESLAKNINAFKQSGPSETAIRSRLRNMMYSMNRKNLGKMTPSNIREKLANKMGLDPKDMPKQVLTANMNAFMKASTSSRNALLKMKARMHRREPKRFQMGSIVWTGEPNKMAYKYSKMAVSRVPTKFRSNSNRGSSSSAGNNSN